MPARSRRALLALVSVLPAFPGCLISDDSSDEPRRLKIRNADERTHHVSLQFDDADTGETVYEGAFEIGPGESEDPGQVLPRTDLVMHATLGTDDEETVDLHGFDELIAFIRDGEVEVTYGDY